MDYFLVGKDRKAKLNLNQFDLRIGLDPKLTGNRKSLPILPLKRRSESNLDTLPNVHENQNSHQLHKQFLDLKIGPRKQKSNQKKKKSKPTFCRGKSKQFGKNKKDKRVSENQKYFFINNLISEDIKSPQKPKIKLKSMKNLQFIEHKYKLHLANDSISNNQVRYKDQSIDDAYQLKFSQKSQKIQKIKPLKEQISTIQKNQGVIVGWETRKNQDGTLSHFFSSKFQ